MLVVSLSKSTNDKLILDMLKENLLKKNRKGEHYLSSSNKVNVAKKQHRGSKNKNSQSGD